MYPFNLVDPTNPKIKPKATETYLLHDEPVQEGHPSIWNLEGYKQEVFINQKIQSRYSHTKRSKIWCVFSVDNNYDQPDYNLVAWWKEKPSKGELSIVIGNYNNTSDDLLKHGRAYCDGTLYRLEEVAEGWQPWREKIDKPDLVAQFEQYDTKCDQCGKQFDTNKSMKQHRRDAHKM